MSVKITWLGHSAFLLVIDGFNVLIDPFLTGNPSAAADPATVPADFILLSHGHDDHVGDTIAIARRTDATVVANNEIAGWLRERHGLKKLHTLNPGGGVQLPFGRVELTIAHHSSCLPDGTYGGEPNGILIFTNHGQTIYHAGDTTAFMDMQLISEHDIDVAMLPIGDYYTMGPETSLTAIDLLEPRAVIPMHYNTFEAIKQDPQAWAQRVAEATDATPVVLALGGTHEL